MTPEQNESQREFEKAMIGDENPRAKISNKIALSIAKEYRRLSYSKTNQRELAKKYGISVQNVGQIVTGRTWSKVTGIKKKSYDLRKISRKFAFDGSWKKQCPRCEVIYESDSLRGLYVYFTSHKGRSQNLSSYCRMCSKEKAAERGKRNSEYSSWIGIKQRCYNPKNSSYPRYGGRGIYVCKRWRNSFSAFMKDMGPKPKANYSIERINNDDGYTPSNCKWATSMEQNRNTSRVRYLRFKGKKMNLTDWANTIGVDPHVLSKRLKRGWSIEKTLTTKSRTAPFKKWRADNGLL